MTRPSRLRRSGARKRAGGRPAASRAPSTPRPPAATCLRAQVERASVRPLLGLMRLPRWITGLVVAALLAVGLFVSGPLGGLALVPVAVLLAWLTYLSWPALGTGARLLRLAGVLVVVAYTGVRLAGG